MLLLFTAVSLPVSAQDGKATDDYGVEEANNKFAAVRVCWEAVRITITST